MGSYKQKADAEDLTSSGGVDISEIPQELFEGAVSKTNADSSTTVTISISSDKFKTLYKDVVLETLADVISGEDLTGVTVKDAKIEYTIADGLFKKTFMSYTIEYEYGGSKVAFGTSVDVEYTSIGKDVTITPMEGYQSFPEMDEG